MDELYLKIVDHFYGQDDPLRALLLKHSSQVKEKALEILHNPLCNDLQIRDDEVICGAMLHDIGILRCHAPSILCNGTEPYIAHGIIGAQMLRQYGTEHDLPLEKYARICERHTGTGLTAEEIREQSLPLPIQDYLPETSLEKLICFADKFFSKSGDMLEKSPERVRRSLEKFGTDTLERYDAMCRMFHFCC